MLIDMLRHDNIQTYLFVIVTITISIVLHELAHGWAAIKHGDDTPIHTGHMTGNPLVHMGPFSLFAMCLFGIAWGQIPIDSTRLRGKYAQAIVAATGPAANLLLAAATLTALGLLLRGDMLKNTEIHQNLGEFLMVFGSWNLMLCVFNLMPVPPLDGSHILSNFHRGYARLIDDPSKQSIWFFGFIGVFMVSRILFQSLDLLARKYTFLVAGQT